MARRFIGEATVYIRLDDHDVFHCRISVRGRHCYTCEIRPPVGRHFNDVGFGLGVALDAPEAFDRVASSAIAFGADDGEDGNDAEHASLIREATDWAIQTDGSYVVCRLRRYHHANDMSPAAWIAEPPASC